jgi:adenosine deaminase
MDIAKIPKIELHCHLDGILSADVTAEIRKLRPDYPLQPQDFANKSVQDYDSFWQWWSILTPVRKQLRLLFPALQVYISRLKRQNVRYLELMIGSSDAGSDTAEALDNLQELREWVNHEEGGEIQVEFMIACGRQHTPETLEARADRMIALHEAGLICGVAIGGPEPDNPVKPFTKTLARWHEAGLGIEIHAGEWVGPESVWDALSYGYPDRIGHGVALFDDPKLIEVFQEKQIHIEMCPTSNLRTGSIKRIEDHPIKQALELGLNFSVNTDDPGPFECSMDSEYALLARKFGFSEEIFRTIYAYSLAARFQKNLRVIV